MLVSSPAPLSAALKPMKVRPIVRLLPSVLLLMALTATNGRPAGADGRGLSPEGRQRIHDMIQQRIEAKTIAGAVALISRDGRTAYFEAQGLSDIEAGRPMARDSCFRIFSMTKPVIGTAILMLVEAGKLQLDDPVAKFLPAFKGMSVAVPSPVAAGVSAAGPNTPASASQFTLEPARRDITIRDLLTHTSGLGSGPLSNAAIARLDRTPNESLSDYIPRLGTTPLEFQPGTLWRYSGEAGFSTLGRIVEIASGQKLDQFLQQCLFEPLGMKSTTFAPSAEERRNLATVYRSTAAGLLREADQNRPIDPVYLSGGAGLTSTAEDYFRFAQMLANGGQFNGRRILGAKMVEAIRAEEVPDTLPGRSPGEAWGLGVRVISASPANFMIQLSNAGGASAETARAFEAAVMQAL
jgi:CubicO group peptidase (beta-lactamase class C family)